jgi:hypothetical protein
MKATSLPLRATNATGVFSCVGLPSEANATCPLASGSCRLASGTPFLQSTSNGDVVQRLAGLDRGDEHIARHPSAFCFTIEAENRSRE